MTTRDDETGVETMIRRLSAIGTLDITVYDDGSAWATLTGRRVPGLRLSSGVRRSLKRALEKLVTATGSSAEGDR